MSSVRKLYLIHLSFSSTSQRFEVESDFLFFTVKVLKVIEFPSFNLVRLVVISFTSRVKEFKNKEEPSDRPCLLCFKVQ